MSQHDAMEFKFYKKMFDEKCEGDVKDVIKELTELIPDAKVYIEKSFNKEKKQNGDLDVVKGFCRCYSSSDIYNAINFACWTKEYSKLVKTISIVLSELVENLNLIYEDCHYLYRGIRCSYDTLKKDYKKGSKGYWPSYSSTSLDLQTALNFSEDFQVIFRIKLSSNLKKIHPCIKMESFSEFPEEQEVLLFPFFAFVVNDIIVEEGVTTIDLQQDIENSVISIRQYDYSQLK